MELLPDDVYYSRLNAVNLASGALIRDEQRRVLIVNPTYRDHWLIPGGCVDKDESPLETCRREIFEEIGLELEITRLLSIEYLARRDYKPEAVHFIFDGGILTESEISSIRPCEKELSEVRFVEIDEACELVNDSLAVRFRAAWEKLDHADTAYLERGEKPSWQI